MSIKCEQVGHDWRATTASGWFQCQRAIGFRAKTGNLVYCRAMAVCPGCLGYAVAGMLPVFCSAHQGLTLDAFPVYQSSTIASESDHSSYEQSSLW